MGRENRDEDSSKAITQKGPFSNGISNNIEFSNNMRDIPNRKIRVENSNVLKNTLANNTLLHT
jgi:hypothetical protein